MDANHTSVSNGEHCVLLESGYAVFAQLLLAVATIGALVFKWQWVQGDKAKRKYVDFRTDLCKLVAGATWLHIMNLFFADQLASTTASSKCTWYFVEHFTGCTLGTFFIIFFVKLKNYLLVKYLDSETAKEWVTDGNYSGGGTALNQPRRIKQVLVFVFFSCTMGKLASTAILMLFSGFFQQLGSAFLSPFHGSPGLKDFFVLALAPFFLNLFQYLLLDSYISPQTNRDNAKKNTISEQISENLQRAARRARDRISGVQPVDAAQPLLSEPDPMEESIKKKIIIVDPRGISIGPENEGIVDCFFRMLKKGEADEKDFIEFARANSETLGLQEFEDDDIAGLFRQLTHRRAMTRESLSEDMAKQILMGVETFLKFDKDGNGAMSADEFKKYGCDFFVPPKPMDLAENPSHGSVVLEEFGKGPAELFGMPGIFTTGSGTYKVVDKVDVEQFAIGYTGRMKVQLGEYKRASYNVGAVLHISHIVVPIPHTVVRGYVTGTGSRADLQAHCGWVNLWAHGDGQKWCEPMAQGVNLQELAEKAKEDWRTLQKCFDEIHSEPRPGRLTPANSKEWNKFLHLRMFSDAQP